MTGGIHKTPLIGWHSADRTLKPWIDAEAQRRGVTASAVLDEALAEYRARRSAGRDSDSDTGSTT